MSEHTATIDALSKPFPKEAVKQRRGGGGASFDYIAGPDIIRRLTRATGGDWSWHIKSFDFRPQPSIKDRNGIEREQWLVVVMGELTIPGLGTRAGIGVQKVSEAGGEDLVKGASTDALKKAATLFGVALELYGEDFEEEHPPARPHTRANAPVAPPANSGRAEVSAPAPKTDEDLLAIVNDDTRIPERRVKAGRAYVAVAVKDKDEVGVNMRVGKLTSLPKEEREAIRAAALAYLRGQGETPKPPPSFAG